MDGLIKTVGILLVLIGAVLWVTAALLAPAALVKLCWLYLFA